MQNLRFPALKRRCQFYLRYDLASDSSWFGDRRAHAALTLKRRSPQLDIQILRDPDIGVIGVGEGTTPNVHQHLLGGLGIKHRDLYERAAPTWKLGIRFLWGPRKDFFYSFVDDLNGVRPGMKMPVGYYCDEEFTNLSPPMALMGQGYAFQRDAGQMPDLQPWFALHIENHKLVGLLEEVAVERGIRITDGKVTEVVRGEKGITALRLADGQCKEADFFIDASGFKSELLGGALEEPFQSFGKTLFL
jgi:tryptophan 7-halogenase